VVGDLLVAIDDARQRVELAALLALGAGEVGTRLPLAVAAPPSSVMKWRRFIRSPRRRA
jgi:hypothetical protein